MLLNAPAANSVMLSTEANVCLLACPVITRRTITLVRRVTPLALHVEGLTRIIALRAPTPFPSLTELVFNTVPPASGATEIPDVNSVCSVRLAAKLVHWKKMVSALLAVSAKINGSSIPPRFSAWILHQIFALKVFVCITSKYYEFNISNFLQANTLLMASATPATALAISAAVLQALSVLTARIAPCTAALV